MILIVTDEKTPETFKPTAGHPCAISIIIPVYNTEAYLKECIDSVLNQSFRDFELICVDDESTDRSMMLLRKYENLDTRVRVFAIPHGGQSAARNQGMREAQGKYIYFMDSDDKLTDGALQTMYALIEERDVDILYFDGAAFFDTEKLAEEYSRYTLYYKRPFAYREVVSGAEMYSRMSMDRTCYVSPWLQITKHDYLKTIGFWFYEGIIYEDNLFLIETMLLAERVSHENLSLYLRRIRNQSTIISEKTYRNFYGFFICWIMIKAFAYAHRFQKQTLKVLNKRISVIRSKAINNGTLISVEEIKKEMEMEPPIVRFIYYMVFHTQIVRRAKRNAGISENILRKGFFGLLDHVGYIFGSMMARKYGGMRYVGRQDMGIC